MLSSSGRSRHSNEMDAGAMALCIQREPLNDILSTP